MNIVTETSRKPAYYKDINYGKLAENDFLDFIKKHSNYKCFDVRGIKEYQHNDIDFVLVAQDQITELPDIDVVLNDKMYKKIEVKLDSRGITTGNFPYEVISHSSSGWCMTTKSDLVYLVLVDRDDNVIRRRAWVSMKKWHKFCADRSMMKRVSYIKSEDIVDLLCSMDDMEKNGVLKWIE